MPHVVTWPPPPSGICRQIRAMVATTKLDRGLLGDDYYYFNNGSAIVYLEQENNISDYW